VLKQKITDTIRHYNFMLSFAYIYIYYNETCSPKLILIGVLLIKLLIVLIIETGLCTTARVK